MKGNHSINWDAQNIPSGIYLIKFVTTEVMITKKIMIIK